MQEKNLLNVILPEQSVTELMKFTMKAAPKDEGITLWVS